MMSTKNILGAAGTVLLLTGCDSIRSGFGLDHYQADEFNVLQNPPLSLPPDYHLNPPATDAALGPVNESVDQGKQLILGEVTPAAIQMPTTTAEAVVETAAAIQKPDEEISQKIEQDAEADESFLHTIGNTIAQNAANTGEIAEPSPEAASDNMVDDTDDVLFPKH